MEIMSKSIPIILKLEHDGKVVYMSEVDDLPDVITIGRASGNTWMIPREDHSASASHGKIEKKGRKLLLTDLNSKNGIYFQEKRIKKSIIIKEGGIYSIGECRLVAEKSKQTAKEDKSREKFHKLEQLSGDSKGKIINLTKETTWIGSGKDCDIVISNSIVSHRHARIQSKADGTCWVCDGDEKGNPSKNGTRVNQAPVTTETTGGGRMLKDGDILSVAYGDYRFWDRNIVHVSSHIVLKTIIVILTVVLVVGSYLGFQSVMPSAKQLRKEAEKEAEKENFEELSSGEPIMKAEKESKEENLEEVPKHFEEAEKKLKKAFSARGAEDDADQRQKLLGRLESWKDTWKKWNTINKMLSSPVGQETDNVKDWEKINSVFMSLSLDNGSWEWSQAALRKMQVARDTRDLLNSMLTVENLISSSNNDFVTLAKQNEILMKTVNTCKTHKEDCLVALLKQANNVLEDARSLLKDHEEIDRIIKGFTNITNVSSVYDKIIEINEQNHSTVIQDYCKIRLEPLEKVRQSYSLLNNNYRRLAMFDRSAINIKLSLPTDEECAVSANFQSMREELLKIKERQILISRLLSQYENKFKANELFIGQTSSDLNELFNEKSLELVLDCDCLQKRLPNYDEKEPTSCFDRWLGVHVFIDYLNSLDGEFDSSIQEGTSKPLVFRISEQFELINTFYDFCLSENSKDLSNDMKKIRDVEPARNMVLKLMKQSQEYVDKKTRLMRKLLNIYSKSPDKRRGIIAGGILCLLRDRQTNFVSEDFQKEVYKSFMKVHREVKGLLDMDVMRTPEERRECEQKAWEIGIPGEMELKVLWNSKFKKEVRR